jgi:hypothetical protein
VVTIMNAAIAMIRIWTPERDAAAGCDAVAEVEGGIG